MNISDAILLMRAVCNRKHYFLSTEKTYTHWLRRFGLFLKAHKLAATTPEQKMEAFLIRLAAQGSAAATQNQAFNSLLFFYREVLKHEMASVQALRARPSVTLRECPNPEEVARLLAAARDVHGYPTRLLVHILYACGLRVSEPLNLRIKDLDLANSRFNIRQAKGKNYAKVAVMRRWDFGDRVERTLSLYLAGGWGSRKAGEICEKRFIRKVCT